MTVNEKDYEVLRLLGKGKGGYSYLVTDGEGQYVLKQIHHEPCDYYRFGDKLASELADYDRLQAVGLRMPRLLAVDREQERLLKEYIDGPTVMELTGCGGVTEDLIGQMGQTSEHLRENGLNIDYYPTNFVVRDGALYYIDYECNSYMDQWSFENWGIQYWRNKC